jgi:hypothetical protein
MTKKQKDILTDMAGFIMYAQDNRVRDIKFTEVLATLNHDVGGLLHKAKHFLPRTWNYAKHLVKLRKG